jgi:amino acid adenylation domain-containing protein/non-ribosomal peptide synthase protein (TIGR01720 family)
MLDSPGLAVGAHPLSPLQQGKLFHSFGPGGRGVDVEQVLCSLTEALDVRLLLSAWDAVVARHDILRSSFEWEGRPEPVQIVHPQVKLPVRVIDWSHVAPAEQRDQLAKFMAVDRARGFDLSEAPLMRLTIISCGGSRCEILWTFHHIILDSQSISILLLEVFGLCDSNRSGKGWTLPERRQYFDYVDWLRARTPETSEPFWRRQLAGVLTPTPLLAAVATGKGDSASGTEMSFTPEETYRLHAFARKAGCTISTLVSAAWALLLSRYTGEQNVVFGVTRTCRQSSIDRADEAVGLFVNTLPFRVNVPADTTVLNWLAALRAQQIDLREHEHTPLSLIQAWSDVPRGTPLFETEVVFEKQRLDSQLRRRGGDWATRRFVHLGQSGYPVTLVCFVDSEIVLRLAGGPESVDPAVAARMLRHLRTIVKGLTNNRTARLSAVPMIDEEERAGLLPAPRPSGIQTFCLHERFERRASETPDAAALSFAGRTLSYQGLNHRANQLAHRLRSLGVGPEVLVGLQLERSPELVMSVLAVLKAGGAWVPLDPGHSSDHRRFIADDAQLAVIVTSRQLVARLPPREVVVVCVEDVEGEPEENLPPVVEPDSLAYVTYMSGSTPQASGVLISHANVSRLFDASEIWFQFAREDVWTLGHSHASDLSVWEIWGALLYGGRLVIVPNWVSRDPDALIDLLARERVTVLSLTPSAFRRVVQADGERLNHAPLALRSIVLCGETLDASWLRPWFERHGDERPRVFSTFGLPETTIHTTHRRISKADAEAGTARVIGVPIDDLDVYVLDRHQQLAPVGITGEMYIGGPGIARGYLDRTDLTRQRFVNDPANRTNSRIYRSGCCARWLPNGELEFRGRIDRQIEIRGRRVELEEIDAVLRQCPGLRDGSVVACEEPSGSQWLAAYVVLDRATSVEQVRLHLQSRLPEYLLPSAVLPMQALPVMPDGRIDRQALPVPSLPVRTGCHVAPRNEIELALAMIWTSVLGCEVVGVEDNFFELGGDSMSTIQVIARSCQLGLHVTTRDVFTFPTIASLAAAIASRSEPSIPDNGPSTAGLAVTPTIHRFLEQPLENRNHWNEAVLLNVPSYVDAGALDLALDAVVERHDVFRLRLREDAAGWHAGYVPAHHRASLERVDLRDYPAEMISTAIESTAASVQAGLDITDGPVLRVVHFACAAGQPGRLLIVMHYVVADAGVWPVFLEDLQIAYTAARAGRGPVLPGRTTSFSTWAERLAAYTSTGALEGLARWAAGIEPVSASLPRDRDGNPELNTEASTRTVAVSLTTAETAMLVDRATAAYSAEVDDLVLASLAQVLVRWTGRDEVLVDVCDRRRPKLFDDVDLSRTVGCFETVVPVKFEIGNRSLADLVQRTTETISRLHHRGLSFGALRYLSEDSNVRKSLDAFPQPEMCFQYVAEPEAIPPGSSLFSVAAESGGPCRSGDNRRSHLLEVVAFIKDGRLKLQWTYSNQFHDAATISAVASRCIDGLRELVVSVADRAAVAPRPSGFPLARLRSSEIDRLRGRFPLMSDIYPLTPMQQLLFTMHAVEASSGFEQWEFLLEGSVDAGRLRSAWRQVTARHATLRAVFAQAGAAPHQIVLEHVDVPWHEEDWREQAPERQDELLRRFLAYDRRQSFDLTTPPLVRVALFRIGDTTHRLILSTHQLLVDGCSLPQIIADLSAHYAGGSVSLKPACDYREYVKWLQQNDEVGEAFWRRLLTGVKEATPAPSLASVSGHVSEPAGEVVRSLTPGATGALGAVARRRQVNVNALVSAAWSVVLAHRSGRSDVVFGASLAHRPIDVPGVETMVGPRVNNLPIRVRVDANEQIASWLGDLHRLTGEVARHQTTPLTRVQKCSDIPAWSRMFDSLLVIQDDVKSSEIDGVQLRLLRWAGSSGYPATVMVRLSDQLEIRIIGAGEGFGAASASAAADDFVSVLHSLTELNDGTVGQLLACLPSAFAGSARRSSPWPRRRRGPRLAARTDMEKALVRIWRELFGEDIGTDENYLELGAHSLMMVRAHERIGSTIDPVLPLDALFQFPNIRALAAHLQSRSAPVRRADKIRSYRQNLGWGTEHPEEAGTKDRRA